MGDIFNSEGRKLAKIGNDGVVWGVNGEKLGHVAQDGHVFDKMGKVAGYVLANGDIYEQGKRTGRVQVDGKVIDYNLDYVGKVTGDHSQFGGAALLVLIR